LQVDPSMVRLPSSAARARLRSVVSAVFVAGLLVVAIVTIWLVEGADRRGVVDLPATERSALYERTLENLRLCTRHYDALPDDFCEHEAAFVTRFPECDEGCLVLSRRFHPQPRR
jgi:hypothetical protein